jgi:hypothetical protein
LVAHKNTAGGDSVAESGDLDCFVTRRDGSGTERAHPRCPGPKAAPGPTGPAAGAVLLLAPVPDPESDAALELEPELGLGLAAVPAFELALTEELVLGVGAAGVVDSVSALYLTEWVDPELGRDAAFVTATDRAPERAGRDRVRTPRLVRGLAGWRFAWWLERADATSWRVVSSEPGTRAGVGANAGRRLRCITWFAAMLVITTATHAMVATPTPSSVMARTVGRCGRQ